MSERSSRGVPGWIRVRRPEHRCDLRGTDTGVCLMQSTKVLVLQLEGDASWMTRPHSCATEYVNVVTSQLSLPTIMSRNERKSLRAALGDGGTHTPAKVQLEGALSSDRCQTV